MNKMNNIEELRIRKLLSSSMNDFISKKDSLNGAGSIDAFNKMFEDLKLIVTRINLYQSIIKMYDKNKVIK